MDKEKLDMKAVELSLVATMEEAILGMFGDGDTDEMLHKLHNTIELTDKLKIKNLDIKVDLTGLRKSKKKYEKVDAVEEETDDE